MTNLNTLRTFTIEEISQTFPADFSGADEAMKSVPSAQDYVANSGMGAYAAMKLADRKMPSAVFSDGSPSIRLDEYWLSLKHAEADAKIDAQNAADQAADDAYWASLEGK